MHKSPEVTFVWGAILLFLLFYYLGTTIHRKKKLTGTILTISMAAFCFWAVNGWNIFLGQPINIKLGMDLAGGSSFTVQLKPGVDDEGNAKVISPDSVQQAIAILEKRLNPDGGKDLLTAPQGEDRIIIQMPGVKPEEVQEVRKKIEQVAHLEFRLVHPQSETRLAEMKATGGVEVGYVSMPGKEHEENAEYPESYLVKSRADLQGRYVKRAFATLDPGKGWIIILDFDTEGTKLFAELTAANVGRRLAIVVDDVVISAPRLNDAIDGGRAEISGSFKEKDARALGTALENPLENPMEIIEESSVSAAFGAQTIKQGVYTGVAGLIMTTVFLLVYYRLAGLIALVGLVVTTLMVFGAMALFDFTLTMPGIAGIVLSVGMAVDANVLIYERLREEIKAGKTVVAALDAAFEKAFSAIFDANLTTLISAVILFYLATGLVKGFAVTLMVGIVGTLLGALICTRVVFQWCTDANVIKTLKVTQIIPDRTFDLLSKSRPVIMGSFGLALLCLVVFAVKGERAIGIDFKGGALTRFEIAANQDIPASEVERALQEGGIDGAYVQESTTATGELITVRSNYDDGVKIQGLVEAKFGDKLSGGQTDRVGSVVGKELAVRSILAFTLAMLAIFVYLIFFYEFSFAVGAMIALVHDCIISLGIVVMLGQELSMIHIGALLTLAGYSINDTIVVFDRIRENIKSKSGSIMDVMNQAISATLSRTLLTGVTTLGPMFALYFFGGPAMKDFSMPIIIGVLVGTYSSIYIAAPVVMWFAKLTGKSLRRQVLDSTETDIKPPVATA